VLAASIIRGMITHCPDDGGNNPEDSHLQKLFGQTNTSICFGNRIIIGYK
jgi:hypothetical protein